MDKKPYTVYCIVGDGEMQEGQIWEALMYAAHRKLDNLVVLVDCNRMQIDGMVADVNAAEPLADKGKAFGYRTRRGDGHAFGAMEEALDDLAGGDGPAMAILDTVKGKGVKAAEEVVTSHHMAVGDELFAEALAGLRTGEGA